MTFVTTLALGIAVLVVGPYLAHRLRRSRAQEQLFPPARLVPAAPPRARRRSRLEDRGLMSIRVAQILALALLGATPFARCSRLSLQHPGGASIAMAILIDDSMSMRARRGDKSRFEIARAGARDLVSSAAEGDAVCIVLAGAPARVALGVTTDLVEVNRTIQSLEESDRATDLRGALALADGLLASLPQPDRRVVVLSDLADGEPDGPPLEDPSNLPVWAPLSEIQGGAADCGILSADRRGREVHVSIGCGPQQSALGRAVAVEDPKGQELSRTISGAGSEVDLTLPDNAVAAARVRLLGGDAISTDDVAPIAEAPKRGVIAVVDDSSPEQSWIGGPPVVEQALEALKLDVDLAPLPAFPDRAADLSSDLGVVLDDPPGLTPEQRQAMSTFLTAGGVVLLSLGERSAREPLGATLEPIVARAVTWGTNSVSGANPSSALGPMAGAGASLSELAAPHRIDLDPEDANAFQPLLRWSDGAPLVARRAFGPGEAWIVTLPFSVEASDLPLRSGFVSLLGAWTQIARRRAETSRSEVGAEWRIEGARTVAVRGPSGTVDPVQTPDGLSVVPTQIGEYQLVVDGKAEVRIAAPVPRELDLRARRLASAVGNGPQGGRQTPIDLTPYVALAMLALVATELGFRAASSTGWYRLG